MMKEFKGITTDEGKININQVGILIFAEWDIEDVVDFDAIRKSKDQQFNLEEEARLALKGSQFVDDYATLAIWALEQGPRRPNIIYINLNLRGSIIIKRSSDTSNVEASKLAVDVAKLAHETSKRGAMEKEELMKKFENIFNVYNVVQQRCLELQTKVQLLEQR